MKSYYYHKKGHIKRYCQKLTKYLKRGKIFETQETSNSSNIVDEEFNKEGDILFIIVDENFVDF